MELDGSIRRSGKSYWTLETVLEKDETFLSPSR